MKFQCVPKINLLLRTQLKSVYRLTCIVSVLFFFSYKFGECTRTLIGMGSMNAVGRNVRSIEVSK